MPPGVTGSLLNSLFYEIPDTPSSLLSWKFNEGIGITPASSWISLRIDPRLVKRL